MVLAEVKVDNIYIVCGYTDMRKSITGLSTIVNVNENVSHVLT